MAKIALKSYSSHFVCIYICTKWVGEGGTFVQDVFALKIVRKVEFLMNSYSYEKFVNQLTTKLLRLAPNIICKFSPNLLFDILLHEVTSADLRLNLKLYTQVTRRKCAAPRRLRPAASSPGWRVSSTKSKQNQVYYRGAICAQQANCYNNGRATFCPKK